MFPDLLFIRVVLRLLIGLLDALAPLSILWTALSYLTFPAPPLVLILPLDTLYALDSLLSTLNSYFLLESAFLVLHTFTRTLIASGWWDLAAEHEAIGSEERWRLWVKMLESSDDPWTWLGGMFLLPGKKTAPEGMKDAAVSGVKRETVGRANVEEFLTHYLFNCKLSAIKSKSVEQAELHSMVLLLEYVMTQSPANTAAKYFVFPRGKTKHKVFQLTEEPVVTRHQPLMFYLLVWVASAAGNLGLWMAGFRYYGTRFQLFPLFFMRGSGRALDRLLPAQMTGDAALADKTGYWCHPGSKKARDTGLTPLLFFHGISGTYGSTLFLIYVRWKTGRPLFVPEFPYVTMRLRPPSAILTRRETVAAARRMLFRHGFGLTNAEVEEGEEEEWRRGKAILLGHSLGSGPVTWVLRDAPDIVAGVVLIDPMSVLLYAADAPRNFFRTKVKTASEIFFKYFAQERGINHFLSRHLRWSDSVLFGPGSPAPLPPESEVFILRNALTPLEPPYDIPNYAPFVSPCPAGPLPAVFIYSELDCILPVPKILKYLRACGFDDTNLHVIPKADHASYLLKPYWMGKVAEAIEQVSKAAEVVEKMRWEEELGGR